MRALGETLRRAWDAMDVIVVDCPVCHQQLRLRRGQRAHIYLSHKGALTCGHWGPV